jgi:hypothetical protein
MAQLKASTNAKMAVAEGVVAEINSNPTSDVLYLPLTRPELATLLRTLATANTYYATSEEDKQTHTWMAERILRMTAPRSIAMFQKQKG